MEHASQSSDARVALEKLSFIHGTEEPVIYPAMIRFMLFLVTVFTHWNVCVAIFIFIEVSLCEPHTSDLNGRFSLA